MDLRNLFTALADVFDGPDAIEKHAQEALLAADPEAQNSYQSNGLTTPFLSVMAEAGAHPVCKVIAETPLPWAPPQTTNTPLYVAHSLPKVNVELLGPDGLITSNSVRLGLYGMLPNFEYGIRTHPAEEVFIMLAGTAFWKRDVAAYEPLGPGQRSYHPSMMQHASKTEETAFLSAYVWRGDISTADYVYAGLPTD